MKFELSIRSQFQAFHVLEEREEKHSHIWRVAVWMTGIPREGRVASLPLVRELLVPEINLLSGKYLNQEKRLDDETRKNPTCENLAKFFLEKFSQRLQANAETKSLRVTAIEVAVDELSGEETGAIRLTP